eukprot:3301791-Prymnesium_polylepis.1
MPPAPRPVPTHPIHGAPQNQTAKEYESVTTAPIMSVMSISGVVTDAVGAVEDRGEVPVVVRLDGACPEVLRGTTRTHGVRRAPHTLQRLRGARTRGGDGGGASFEARTACSLPWPCA